MTLAMTWYAVDARKWFKGPRVNVEHTNAEVLDGVADNSSEDAGGEKIVNEAKHE